MKKITLLRLTCVLSIILFISTTTFADENITLDKPTVSAEREKTEDEFNLT